MSYFTLQLHITGECNCRCRHCYIEEHSNQISTRDIEKIILQYLDFVAHFRMKTGDDIIPRLFITGGEPFCHNDIGGVFSLMEEYSDRIKFRLLSNGTLFSNCMLEKLKKTDGISVQVSIDGDRNSHDLLRGEGNFDRVLKGIDMLSLNGIPSIVSFTAHRDNFRSFPEVARICRDHKVNVLWSDRYIPFNSASPVKALTKEETEEYVNILQLEKQNPANAAAHLTIKNDRALQFLASGTYPYRCTAGQFSAAIDERLNVFPCRRLNIPCGNLKESSLTDIYENSDGFNYVRKAAIPPECKGCQHAAYCRGGAKCRSFAEYSSIDIKDPGCWR